MYEIYNKYQKLDQLIKKYHNESFYSKNPLPKLTDKLIATPILNILPKIWLLLMLI